MDEELSFGRWLKLRRVSLRLTQAMLAERTGYSTATIRKLEYDELRASQQIAESLADVLALMPAERSEFIRWARVGAGAFPGQPSSSKLTPHPSLPTTVTPDALP